MKLVESYEPSNENCVELLSFGFDVMSYLEMVDLLAMRLGGDKEYRRGLGGSHLSDTVGVILS